MRGDELIRLNRNSRQKLEHLYTLYESKMYAVAYAILKNESQAEDTVQDSFIKLSDYLDRIRDVSDYHTKALVVKIVKTTAINRYRKNQREAWLYDFQEEKEVEDPDDVIDKKVMAISNSAILENAAKGMPDIYKEVIKYRCYYELSARETAELTGVDAGTIRKRYERAKKYLYDNMMKNQKGTEQQSELYRKGQESLKGDATYEGTKKCSI
ncbi:MAG: RNA polymerase sigma factor [Lachnospira sp.]|nr:RNA polymerase sigma factor [Lachnospira sp.]